MSQPVMNGSPLRFIAAGLVGAALLMAASAAFATPQPVIDPEHEWADARGPQGQPPPPLVVANGPPAASDVPSYASDDDGPRQRHTDYPCVLASDAGCSDWYPHIELGMAWGESNSNVGWQWHYRLWAEVGVLGPIDGERDLQIGPVFNFGGDFGRVTGGYSANMRVKLRYWIAGSPVNLDFGMGPSISHYSFNEGSASGTRMGGITDMSLGVLGIGGIYGSSTYQVDVADSSDGEVRLLGGVRGSLLMWGAVLAAVGQALH